MVNRPLKKGTAITRKSLSVEQRGRNAPGKSSLGLERTCFGLGLADFDRRSCFRLKVYHSFFKLHLSSYRFALLKSTQLRVDTRRWIIGITRILYRTVFNN